jgi:hypothetical protein
MSVGWDCVSELWPLVGLLLSPRRYMSVESQGGVVLTDEHQKLGGNPVPVPLCSPHIPHGLNQARIRALAVRDRRLSAEPCRIYLLTDVKFHLHVLYVQMV